MYSLGATLYFLLAGRAPFSGSLAELFEGVRNKPFPDIHEVRPDVPAEVAALIRSATAKNPEDRPTDGFALEQMLLPLIDPDETLLIDPESGSLGALSGVVSPPPPKTLERIRLSRHAAEPVRAWSVRTALLTVGIPLLAVAGWFGIDWFDREPDSPRAPNEVLASSSSGPDVEEPGTDGEETLRAGDEGASHGPMGEERSARLEAPTTTPPEIESAPRALDAVPGEPSAAIQLDSQPDAEGRIYTSDPAFQLSGRFDEAASDTVIRVRRGANTWSNQFTIDDDGTFVLPLGLTKSAERFTLSVDNVPDVELEIVLDEIPPQVTVLSPGAGDRRVASEYVEVVVRVDEAFADRVLVGNQLLAQRDDGTWAAQVWLREEGTNPLHVEARDKAGLAQSVSLVIDRDTQVPAIVTVDPTRGGTVIAGTEVHLELEFDEAMEEVRVGGVDFAVNGTRATASLAVPDSGGTWTLPLEAADLVGHRCAEPLSYMVEQPAPLAEGLVHELPEPGNQLNGGASTRFAFKVGAHVERVTVDGIELALADGRAAGLVRVPAVSDEWTARIVLEGGAARLEEAATYSVTRPRVPVGWAILDDTWVDGWARIARDPFGIDFVRIPQGSFLMGSPESEPRRERREGPQQTVRIRRGIYMAATETTQTVWEQIVTDLSPLAVGRDAPGRLPSKYRGEQLPVEGVSWVDTVRFCALLRERSSKNYRLPSEAEWEYACRAGTTTPFHSGQSIEGVANVSRYSPYPKVGRIDRGNKTTPVASHPPNGWGLYDMHGNVREWCQDVFEERAYDAVVSQDAREGGRQGADRVVRGGNYYRAAERARSAARWSESPTTRSRLIGFRVVYEPGPDEAGD